MSLSSLLSFQFIDWLSDHYIELFGAITGLVYIFLEIKQKPVMWVVGFITSSVYIIVFFQAKFYADMALNVYYVFISIFGWYSWRFMKKDNGEITERSISRIRLPLSVLLFFISFVLFLIIGYVLDNFTDSPIPYYDALSTALSIVATWMLARKILEHWVLWVFINFFSVILYLWRELYPTALLFMVYGLLSIRGWLEWKRSLKSQLK